MQYAVRLRLDGMLESFAWKKVSKIINKRDAVKDNVLYKAMTSKAPAIIKILAVWPHPKSKSGLSVYGIVGRLSLYRETGMT